MRRCLRRRSGFLTSVRPITAALKKPLRWGRRQRKMSGPNPDRDRPDHIVERRTRRASRSRPHRPAWVAAAIGMLLAAIAGYAVARWERRVTWTEFEGAAATQLIEMQNGVNEYLGRLVTLRALFESANDDVTRSEFEVFGSRLFERHPGVLRVNWLPKVYRKERAEF